MFLLYHYYRVGGPPNLAKQGTYMALLWPFLGGISNKYHVGVP